MIHSRSLQPKPHRPQRSMLFSQRHRIKTVVHSMILNPRTILLREIFSNKWPCRKRPPIRNCCRGSNQSRQLSLCRRIFRKKKSCADIARRAKDLIICRLKRSRKPRKFSAESCQKNNNLTYLRR